MDPNSALSSCRQCGKYFTQRREWQKFCTKLCHNAWHKAELLEAKKALAEKRKNSFDYLLQDGAKIEPKIGEL